MTSARARLFVALQYLLPRFALTSLVYRLARVRAPFVKNTLIRAFVRAFRVDVTEVSGRVPEDFACFNDFFVRELTPGARGVDRAGNALVSPVDGIVSAAGAIERDRLFQAKGRDYTLRDLVATDLDEANAYTDGTFATLYLAPWHYHRVHAPWSGRLVAARYVPGDLFSVNDTTAARVPNLFARNERLILHFLIDNGPVTLIFIGALNVGSITTPWTGEVRPRRRGVVEALDVKRRGHDTRVARGDLLGWFNMGSTVVLLLPPGACELDASLTNGAHVVAGRPIGILTSLAP